MKKVHVTADGKVILLKDLELNHLLNIIKYIKRKAKDGFLIRYGGGNTSDDMWYDEYVIYGKEVKEHLCYKSYKKELKRRGVIVKK